jgi:hypothetical protein
MRRTGGVATIVVMTIIASGAVVETSAEELAAPAQSKSATSATEDPCELLTKQDAATALGEAVSASKFLGAHDAGPGGTVSGCEYTSSGAHTLVLTVRHMPPAQAAIYKQLCAQKGKEGLTGLGDVACWYNEKHQELQVLKGATFFSIELRRSGNPTEAIKGAAKKVFDQLR